ncbi:MAG: hypothetical protein Fur005_44390 [Roseiflexaceae bacterium]
MFAQYQRRAVVLLVDDDPSIQTLFRYILHDVDIICADHGADALLRLERITPDLIISDIIMPVMDGVALLRMVRERPALARIPFVLMSAIGDNLTMIESFHLGVDDYLVKPVSLALFRARIRAILNRPPVPSPLLGVDPQNTLLWPSAFTRAVERELAHLRPPQC